MGIITLTTDLGLKDYYVSAVKGAILKELPETRIVDITHLVPSFDIQQAAYIVKNSWANFPVGTVHIIGVSEIGVYVNTEVEYPFVGIEYQGHFFLGADNGIFSLLFDKHPDLIVELTIKPETPILTFPTRDIFVKAACHLARGGTLEIIGKRKESVYERGVLRPALSDNDIRGTAIYIDSYHNVVYNITEKLFNEVGKGRKFTILFKSHRINKLSTSYSKVVPGEMLALFNTAGHLEIAQNRGGIGKLQNVQMNESIIIEFE